MLDDAYEHGDTGGECGNAGGNLVGAGDEERDEWSVEYVCAYSVFGSTTPVPECLTSKIRRENRTSASSSRQLSLAT